MPYRAKNSIGAAVGDQVIVETSSRPFRRGGRRPTSCSLALLLLGYGLGKYPSVAVPAAWRRVFLERLAGHRL